VQETGVYEVIIIGAGPAGLTSAIYTARAKLRTLVLTGRMIGGQIALTYQVNNYPGFPDGITGPKLVELMRSQAEKFGAEFIDGEATAVDFSSRPLKVYVGNDEYNGAAVIIATGSKNRRLGLQSEERLMGRGVFVCATCDALLYEGKRVVVVGGGDSAVQEALDMSKFAKDVYLVHRRSSLSAYRCLGDRAEENEKIRFILNTEVEEILGEKVVEGIRLRNMQTEEVWTLECEGVLLAIGWVPNTDVFRGQLDIDGNGYIGSKKGVDTSVEGVYICGDLNDRKYRQVITACGSGCIAALEAESFVHRQQK
jgi:thioredoxin reductase (NADPH)